MRCTKIPSYLRQLVNWLVQSNWRPLKKKERHNTDSLPLKRWIWRWLSIKHLRAPEPIDICSPLSLWWQYRQWVMKNSLMSTEQRACIDVTAFHTLAHLDVDVCWFFHFTLTLIFFFYCWKRSVGWLLPPTCSPSPTHIHGSIKTLYVTEIYSVSSFIIFHYVSCFIIFQRKNICEVFICTMLIFDTFPLELTLRICKLLLLLLLKLL